MIWVSEGPWLDLTIETLILKYPKKNYYNESLKKVESIIQLNFNLTINLYRVLIYLFIYIIWCQKSLDFRCTIISR